MNTPIERVNVSKMFRTMQPGDRHLFGRSHNLISLNATKRQVNNALGFDIRIVEVPEGYLAWRKA